MIQQEQVDEIMAFCEAKGVTYYDIQVELVDHIADSIEELQKSNPTLPFSDALDIAGKQFGNEEFTAIVKSKKRLIEKRMSRLIEKEFLSFFTIPRILTTIFLLGISLTLPYMVNYYKWTLFLFLIPVGTIMHLHHGPAKEIRAIKEACRIPLLSLTVKSRYERFVWLIDILSTLAFLIYLLFFPQDQSDIQKIRMPFTTQKLVTWQIGFAGFLILGLLYISSLYVRRKIYNKIFEQYSKAFISD